MLTELSAQAWRRAGLAQLTADSDAGPPELFRGVLAALAYFATH
jgi:hypothetical protein